MLANVPKDSQCSSEIKVLSLIKNYNTAIVQSNFHSKCGTINTKENDFINYIAA